MRDKAQLAHPRNQAADSRTGYTPSDNAHPATPETSPCRLFPFPSAQNPSDSSLHYSCIMRETISLMISVVPPPIGLRRKSRYILSISYSLQYPYPPYIWRHRLMTLSANSP